VQDLNTFDVLEKTKTQASAVKNQWVLTVMPINVPTSTVGVDIGTIEKPY
jgi:hypothetical protein